MSNNSYACPSQINDQNFYNSNYNYYYNYGQTACNWSNANSSSSTQAYNLYYDNQVRGKIMFVL